MSPIPVLEQDESDEVEEVDPPPPKPHKTAGRPRLPRGGWRGEQKNGGTKFLAKGLAAPSQPPAVGPQRPQQNQNKHPVPQRPPPPSGANEARPKRFVDLYIDPESSLATNLYRVLQEALDRQQMGLGQSN